MTSGGCVLLHPSCLLHISFQLTSPELLRANSRHGVIQIHCRVCSADSTTHANTITMTPSLAQLHILLSKMQQSPCISHDAIHTESIIPNTLHKNYMQQPTSHPRRTSMVQVQGPCVSAASVRKSVVRDSRMVQTQ